MSGLDDLLKQLPLDQIAGSIGADPQEVASAAQNGLGALLGGLKANAEDPAGAASLANALQQHTESSISSVDDIDVEDGEKIVRNIFGDNTDGVINTLAGSGAGGSSVFSKLLPMLAPAVMGYLANKAISGGGLGGLFGGGQAAGTTGDTGSVGASNAAGQPGGLTDLLGGMLGGSGGGGGGGLTDLLGGLLGGGKR